MNELDSADLEVVRADIQLKLVPNFPPLTNKQKELLDAVVNFAFMAGRISVLRGQAQKEKMEELLK